MANPVLLNNVEHKDLRVLTGHGARLGDGLMMALTFPAEFRYVQAHYPIVFHKDADGTGFQPMALFGLKKGENLFVQGERWDASYVPLSIQRQPFLIGRDGEELVVHVDLDSPRIARGDEGERLFLDHGGTGEYLEHVNSMLLALHEGMQATPAFVASLMELELLESFVVDIELAGSQNRLAGFYTINEDRLGALDGEALGRLHQRGYLQPIYMVIASQENFRALIARLDPGDDGQH
jgi:hypothetical protein